MRAFLAAALRGHNPEAIIFPLLILGLVLTTLVVGLRVSAARSSRQPLD